MADLIFPAAQWNWSRLRILTEISTKECVLRGEGPPTAGSGPSLKSSGPSKGRPAKNLYTQLERLTVMLQIEVGLV